MAGSDDLGLLDYFDASAGGELLTHIILREKPRLIEVWEEFLHGTQAKCRLPDGRKYFDVVTREEAEIHVKRFMVRHRGLIGLADRDVEVLFELLGEGRDAPPV